MKAFHLILLSLLILNSVRANWVLDFAEGIKEGIQESFQAGEGKDAKSKDMKEKVHQFLGNLGKKVGDWHKKFAKKHGIKDEKSVKEHAHKIWKNIKHHVLHKMLKNTKDSKSGHPQNKEPLLGQHHLFTAEEIFHKLAKEWAEKLKKKTGSETKHEEPKEKADGPTPPSSEESLSKKAKSLKAEELKKLDVTEKKAEKFVTELTKEITKPADKESGPYFPVDVLEKKIEPESEHPKSKRTDFEKVVKKTEEKEQIFAALENDWEKDLKEKEEHAKKEFEMIDKKKEVLPDFVKVESIPEHHERQEQLTKNVPKKEGELFMYFKEDSKKEREKEKQEPFRVEEGIEVLLPNKEIDKPVPIEKKQKEIPKEDKYWQEMDEKQFQETLTQEESAWSKFHSNLMHKLREAEKRVASVKNKINMKFNKDVPINSQLWVEE